MEEKDYLALTPMMRAFALVGTYLSGFGMMESRLNRIIGSILDLEPLQEAIVTKNIQFSNKVKIVRCLAGIGSAPPANVDDLGKFFNRMNEIGVERNMVAHDLFGPDEKELGVEFFAVKATGKLHFPEQVWSIKDVLNKHTEMMNVRNKLGELKTATSISVVTEALLRANPPPIGGLFALSGSYPGSHLPPVPPNWSLLGSIPDREPQTPEAPSESEDPKD